MKQKPKVVCDLSQCLQPDCCPLAHVRAGTAVRIRQLSTTPEVADRLREMGVYEDQKVRLVLKGHNIICQVCNARLGISTKLAENILVEPINAPSGSHS